MSDLNITFCRALLAQTMERVRRHTTPALREKAWVYKTARGQWEFQGPNPDGRVNQFYWFGRADNAYEARAKGWSAWLEKFYPEQEDAA